MNDIEHKDIYKKLEGARSVRPRELFRKHFYSVIESETKNRAPSFSPFKLAFTGIALFIVAGTGLAAASQNSDPGSVLYPVKEAVNKAKAVFSVDPAEKALLHLEEAEKNISEMEKSAATVDKKGIDMSVEQYQENVGKARNEAGRSGDSSAVEEELGRQAEKLSELETKVPTQAQTGIKRAIEANQNTNTPQSEVKGAQNQGRNEVGNPDQTREQNIQNDDDGKGKGGD